MPMMMIIFLMVNNFKFLFSKYLLDAISMDSNDELFNMNEWNLNKIKIKYLDWNHPYEKNHVNF